MRSRSFMSAWLAGVLAVSGVSVIGGGDFSGVCAFAAANAPAGTIAFKGKDGWLYSVSELRHLAAGRFFVTPPKGPQGDPIPAIVDFNAGLRKLGVKLILVPVPPKATVYPEGLSAVTSPDTAYAVLREFYGRLKADGIEVLDLHDAFVAAAKSGRTLYCRQDSHWNPDACAVAAKAIAGVVRDEPWARAMPHKSFQAEQKEIELTGDLWTSLGDKTIAKEKVHARRIGGAATVAAGSPLLVIGDSHALVFHSGGDMLAENSGLVDQLAYELGFPVDLLAVRGSGATPVRISLYRKAKQGDWFNHVKTIVWCFSAREFTEAAGGWRKVPIKGK